MLKATFILSYLAGLTFANDRLKWFEAGFCPTKPKPVGNFEAERYQGNWYEI